MGYASGMIEVLLALHFAQGVPSDPPMTKLQEKAKYHAEKLVATDANARLKSYEDALRNRDQSVWQNLPWRPIGPESQSCRVVDIESPANHPDQIFIAYATGGLWRTDDEGGTFTPLFEKQSSFGIGDFDVTADGKTIWVGTGENNSQRTSFAGTGVFKSTDGGKTWLNMGLRDSHHIGRVIIDPKNPDIVWVGSIGPLYSDLGERGIYKTTDGGKTWKSLLPMPEDTGVIDVVMDPSNSNTVYIATWERERRAWNFREGGPGTAIFKTTDGGAKWTKLAAIPGQDTGRIGLAMSPANPKRLFAFVDNQSEDRDADTADEFTPSDRLTLRRFRLLSEEALRAWNATDLRRFVARMVPRGTNMDSLMADFAAGKKSKTDLIALFKKGNPAAMEAPLVLAQLYRSDDAGTSWKAVSQRMGDHGGYYWNRAVAHPIDPNQVFTLGLWALKSIDAGSTWSNLSRSMHVDYHALWIDRTNPNRMVAGNDGGAYLSRDGGKNWRPWNTLPVGQPTTLAIEDKAVYNVFVGLQDNGTMKGPSTHRPGVDPLSRWTSIGGGDGSYIAIDPRGDVVYTASQFGSHSAFDQAKNQRWPARAPDKVGEPDLRYNWISPFAISQFHPDIVYVGSQKLHRSFNQGRKWEDISPDLTSNREQGDVPHASLTFIAESPFKFGTIYVGADDGSLQRTFDGGATWKSIQTPLKTKWVSRLIASTHVEGRIYCTQTGYREDDFRPYVWVSDDHGSTWKSISANLPLESVSVIREDPSDPKILFVGTDRAVYVTTDGGTEWMEIGNALPHCAVHDIAIASKAKELVAATHGRSVWIADISSIYDLSEDVKAKPLFMWSPRVPAYSDRWGFDSREPWESPRGGDQLVSVRYWSAQKGATTLSIMDGDKVVKSVSLNAVRGINYGSISLKIATGDPNAPGDFSNPAKDPYAKRRDTYLGQGRYDLVLKNAAGESRTDFRL